jgi:hypothetical protein
MSSVDVRLKFSAEQLAALDAYRALLYRQHGIRASRSQAIRDLIGRQVEAAGLAWPEGPQLGGDRRSQGG